jgi:hypothetical protein
MSKLVYRLKLAKPNNRDQVTNFHIVLYLASSRMRHSCSDFFFNSENNCLKINLQKQFIFKHLNLTEYTLKIQKKKIRMKTRSSLS